jgi:hypothetical protein
VKCRPFPIFQGAALRANAGRSYAPLQALASPLVSVASNNQNVSENLRLIVAFYH